jgi:type IV pilus assembly protein PilC
MIDAGVPLGEALSSVTRQQQRLPAKAVMRAVEEDVIAGLDFSAALAKQPASFPRVLTALVKASEKGGMLPALLERAMCYLKDEREIIRKVRGAITYPAIMFAFACTTSLFLLAFVLPRFAKIYDGKGAALPTPTKILMAASEFVVGHWLALLTLVGGLGVGLWWWLGTPNGRAAWQRLSLRLPVIGPMFRTLHLARGLRTVGTLAGAGVPLMDSVETAKDLTDNVRFRALWGDTADALRQGASLTQPLEQSGLVPDPMVQILRSGEAGGKLGKVAEHAAGHAEAELKDSIAAATRYIEPIMIIGMGVVIGGVTLAMLLPVFSLSKVVAQ